MWVLSRHAGEQIMIARNIQIKVISIDDKRQQYGSMSRAKETRFRR